jgi:hypothetical protein
MCLEIWLHSFVIELIQNLVRTLIAVVLALASLSDLERVREESVTDTGGTSGMLCL